MIEMVHLEEEAQRKLEVYVEGMVGRMRELDQRLQQPPQGVLPGEGGASSSGAGHPGTGASMEDEMERRFHQLKAVSEKGAEEMEEEVAETDPDQDVEQEDLKGKGKIPQRVRPDQPFALQNPHAPWPVVVPYGGVPLHPDEPHSAGLVYLEDAERGREVFEREARKQHTEAEWKALPPWKRQHIIEWRKARGKGRKGKGIGGKYEGGKEQEKPEGGGPDSRMGPGRPGTEDRRWNGRCSAGIKN